MLRVKSIIIPKNDIAEHSLLWGVQSRLYWLDALFINAADIRYMYLSVNETLIAQIEPEVSVPANNYFYYVLEHPLIPGDRFIFQQDPIGGGAFTDTLIHVLYHDLYLTTKEIPPSYHFPYIPDIPYYPYVPVPPSPVDPNPPYPPLPPEPPYPDIEPVPPFEPEEPEILVIPVSEEVTDFKSPIPVTFAQKNTIKHQPFVTSALRPSFFPKLSYAQRAKCAFDYTRSFSHLLAEGAFQTLPLRASETGQLITTNTKDDYRVISHQHSDANYHDYFLQIPFTHITFKTGPEAWKLKILPVYRWLSRYELTNMDEITLEASTTSYFPYYAISYSLKCPTASGGSPKTITGHIEF